MHRLVTGGALVVALTGLTAPTALAASAYMNGAGGVNPGWWSITAPGGQTCRVGCTQIPYDYDSVANAAARAGAWMDAHDTASDVLFVYSLSSTGAMDARAARPDWQGQIVALGSPATPGNGNDTVEGGRPPLDVGGGAIQFVTVAGDSVAEPRTAGGSLMTHVIGYAGRDFATETPVSSTHVTPSTTSTVYAAPTPWKFPTASTTPGEARQARTERRQEVRVAVRAVRAAIRAARKA
jgi:hypothetical protein